MSIKWSKRLYGISSRKFFGLIIRVAMWSGDRKAHQNMPLNLLCIMYYCVKKYGLVSLVLFRYSVGIQENIDPYASNSNIQLNRTKPRFSRGKSITQ